MTSTAAGETSGGRRLPIQVTSLDDLVGAHPDTLRKIYGTGRATDPGELGDAPRGRLLTLAQGKELFLVTRPIVRALASGVLPWEGKTFDHGGNSGQNVFRGRHAFR